MTGLAASSCVARTIKGVIPACFSFAGMLAAIVEMRKLLYEERDLIFH